jgi:hypothetical protein
VTFNGVVVTNFAAPPGTTYDAVAVGQVVCTPTGGNSCAEGAVTAGEAVCSITSNYNSGTGVLTFKPVKRVSQADLSKDDFADIGGSTCTLPGAGGRYTVTVNSWWVPELIG